MAGGGTGWVWQVGVGGVAGGGRGCGRWGGGGVCINLESTD